MSDVFPSVVHITNVFLGVISYQASRPKLTDKDVQKFFFICFAVQF